MSIKTLRKRIALVAVSALGVGLLSVAPASANFDLGDYDVATPTNLVNFGVCTYTNTDVLGTTVAVAVSGSTVRLVGTGIGAGEDVYVSVSGPAVISSYLVAAGTTAGGTVTPTTIFDDTGAANDTIDLVLTGVGTVAVTFSTSDTAAAVDVIYITSVAACANGTYSVGYSDVSAGLGDDATWTANVDEATTAAAGDSLYIRIDGDNSYNANLTTGTWTASATNGALVAYSGTLGTVAALKGTTSAVSTTDADGALQFRIDPASAAAGGTTVVTVTHNGTVAASKTLTFYGEAKSVKIVACKVGARSGAIATETTTGFCLYDYLDAAGSSVPGAAATFSTTTASMQIPTAASVKAPTSTASAVADAGTGLVDAIETAIGSTKYGVFAFTCGATSGSAKFTIKHVNAITEDVLTAEATGACAGGIDTYTVSADKASYAIGEIATFTITAKDSSGAAVADSTVMAVDTVSVGGGTLTRAVAATDAFTGGVRTVKAQMTTAGTFNVVVSLTGTTTTSATASYKVASDGSVTNAEVLAAIVKLIASINKQIKALQKSLKK